METEELTPLNSDHIEWSKLEISSEVSNLSKEITSLVEEVRSDGGILLKKEGSHCTAYSNEDSSGVILEGIIEDADEVGVGFENIEMDHESSRKFVRLLFHLFLTLSSILIFHS